MEIAKLGGWLLVVAALLTAAACTPTWAPPARMNHYGAPARPQPKRVELGGAFDYPTVGYGGGGFVGYAFDDRAQLEVGADGLGQDGFVMGYAGVRFDPLGQQERPPGPRLALDLEGGVGAGVGGEHCWEGTDEDDETFTACDGIRWRERAAGGGYLGLGLGMNVSWFDLYARIRFQLTGAEQVPATFWFTGIGGVQATILKRVRLYVAGGWAQYYNAEDGAGGFLVEAGLAVYFGGDESPAPVGDDG